MTKLNSSSVKTALLVCGILSTLLYIAAICIGAGKWDGYDSYSQTVSELIAIDAPSASIVIPLFVVYSILVFAFGTGIWLSAGSKKMLRAATLLIMAKEVLGLIATLFTPMHLRGIEVSATDSMHALLTMLGVLLCMLPAIILGALSFDKKFRIYSILTIVIFLIFGMLAGMEGAKIAENQPTPHAGIWERINIFTYFAWTIVLAMKLLRNNRRQSSLTERNMT